MDGRPVAVFWEDAAAPPRALHTHTQEYANSTVGLDCEVFPRAERKRLALADFAQIFTMREMYINTADL